MRISASRKIALAYPASVPWFARLVKGIRSYVQENARDWRLFSSPPSLLGTAESALTIRSLQGWRGDGIILVSNDRQELQLAREMEIPVINLAAGLPESHGVPRVMVNHYLAGQMAAEHLLGQGLRNFAFFGWEGVWYSEQRRLGFSARIAQAGAASGSFLQAPHVAAAQNWTQGIASLTEWLRSLPTPAGIFAVHDYRAQLLIEACQEAGLRIPDDIAVIGMDNDEVVCEHSVPTLTSVSRNSERVGWETAALLDRLMEGEASSREIPADVLLAPDGVVARQSTDRLYCSDPIVQRAVDYMRANLDAQFNIAHLAEHAGVSKRTLEMRFREETGASPHDYLNRLRVRHAQALLLQPRKRTVEQIAAECGFGTVPTFYAAFLRVSGQSLTEFRRDLATRKVQTPSR
jgi:LacI family transcriptional regulator